MKKLLTLFYALIIAQPLFITAQSLQKVDSAQLSVKAINTSHWLDIDNDGEHELLLQAIIGDDSTIFTTFNWENLNEDTLSTPVFTTFPVQIEDIDNNNQLDIIGFNKDAQNQQFLTILTQIESSFEITFHEKTENVQNFFVQDWDKNGFKDLLMLKELTDSLELSILKNTANGFDAEPEFLIRLPKNSQINFLDVNQNGRMDVLVTSNESASTITPQIYLNHKDSIEVKESKLPQGKYNSIGFGDYNHDGKLDFFATYTNNNGEVQHVIFLNDSIDFENYIPIDFNAFEAGKSFLADFNADGLTDVFITDNVQSAVLYQIENGFDIELISDSTTMYLNFYDENRDGKLDLSTFTKTDTAGIAVFYWENQTPAENLPPYVPSFHVAFQTSEGIAIVWNDSEDDHTIAENITYDVFIGQNTYNTDFLAPNFNINTSNRLKTMRGNNYYGNELNYNSLPTGSYSYGIQPIDNSLVVAIPEDKIGDFCPEECGGRYLACGEFEICESITENMINTCFGKTITLGDSSMIRHWYSEKRGLLGTSDTIMYEVTEEDVIYSKSVEYKDCSSNQIFKISIIDEADFKLDDLVICQVEEVALSFPFEVDSVKWYSVNSDFFSDEFSTSIFIENNDQISIEAYLNGCLIEDQFSINIDNSTVEITNSTIQIKRGGSVQLNAIGAEEYEWSPSQYLGQNRISNPIAAPEVTTKFTVKGISVFGCTSYDTVEVKVLQEAFIPELFTPNGDSKNDNLRIYGLMDVTKFEFIIYDREGNIVFKTNDPEQMGNSGWDGTKAGRRAEAGVYFWQVRGNYTDGMPIQLNEKQKGKVLLSK